MKAEALLAALRTERDHLTIVIDVLERRLETPATAERLAQAMRATNGASASGPSRRYAPGTHWTQQPKNKARLRLQIKRAQHARSLKAKGAA
jgi:hypothetical protein